MEINLAIAKPLAVLPGALFSNLFDCIGGTAFQSFLYIPFQLLRNIGCASLPPYHHRSSETPLHIYLCTDHSLYRVPDPRLLSILLLL
jgi:hypothetical protein